MPFGPGYEYGMTPREIQRKWPNLKLSENFQFTSEQTWDYNCVAWALDINDDWIQFEYDENGDLRVDQSVQKYITFFQEKGFVACEDNDLEQGIQKICIYTDGNNIFTHVCLQLVNGLWASKVGEYEDIKHDDLESLSGTFYGVPTVIMKRPINEHGPYRYNI